MKMELNFTELCVTRYALEEAALAHERTARKIEDLPVAKKKLEKNARYMRKLAKRYLKSIDDMERNSLSWTKKRGDHDDHPRVDSR